MKPSDIKKTLNKYLDRHYEVCDNRFYHVNTTELEYGQDIVLECHIVFDFDILACEKVFRRWAFANGLDKDSFGSAYKKPVYWSAEMAQDLQGFHGMDVTAELELLLVQEIANEIDRQIINDLLAINGNQIITPYRQD